MEEVRPPRVNRRLYLCSWIRHYQGKTSSMRDRDSGETLTTQEGCHLGLRSPWAKYQPYSRGSAQYSSSCWRGLPDLGVESRTLRDGRLILSLLILPFLIMRILQPSLSEDTWFLW
jgi:hypothetical protein